MGIDLSLLIECSGIDIIILYINVRKIDIHDLKKSILHRRITVKMSNTWNEFIFKTNWSYRKTRKIHRMAFSYNRKFIIIYIEYLIYLYNYFKLLNKQHTQSPILMYYLFLCRKIWEFGNIRTREEKKHS